MGCDGLPQVEYADSFHKQGGDTVIGWNGPITINETDEIILDIVQEIIKGDNLINAINDINNNNFTEKSVKLVISNN